VSNLPPILRVAVAPPRVPAASSAPPPASGSAVRWRLGPAPKETSSTDRPALDLTTVYDAYAPFVWRSLQRMGVPEGDLEDALQEVFIVVHRKLHSYQESKAKLSTWLFGIGINIARRHRAKARTWQLGLDPEVTRSERPSQEAELQRKQESSLLQNLLGRLRPEHSATFVMFELEGLTCNEIADLTGVPVGTVYSRLHKAREQFAELADKHTQKQRSRYNSAGTR
jgi:RNA polymerase sigma-70 factor, ECF subfamily